MFEFFKRKPPQHVDVAVASPFSDKELETAALHVTLDELPRLCVYDAERRDISQQEFEEAQAKIDWWRQWADGLEDKRVRRAYFVWIDCSQRQMDEAKAEMRTHAKRKESERNRQRWDEERENAKALARVLPRPTPQ